CSSTWRQSSFPSGSSCLPFVQFEPTTRAVALSRNEPGNALLTASRFDHSGSAVRGCEPHTLRPQCRVHQVLPKPAAVLDPWSRVPGVAWIDGGRSVRMVASVPRLRGCWVAGAGGLRTARPRESRALLCRTVLSAYVSDERDNSVGGHRCSAGPRRSR